MLNLSIYITKMSYDVIQVKYWPKNAQILENDFGKFKTGESSNFQEIFLNKFDTKFRYFEEKIIFLDHEKTQKVGIFPLPAVK